MPQSAVSNSGLQTYQVPVEIPEELTGLINDDSSMFVSNPTGSLLGPIHAQFGQFDTATGKSTVSSDYVVPLALLPPSLLDRTLKDVGLLVTQGPESLTTVIVGALTFDEVNNPSDKMLKERQVPLTGPIGNFVAQLIGAIW
ncbi:hypothetical protein GTA08_BOTSDO11341 [Neofusicoccum parvum]|uniref:Uncharacterized protein n=1 Tax=Botryosphaeria parva (strain UCR-NP2) TaxID=1287680 RepID=R1EM44_BOTPV|nr:hypothetical protein UCRNP2_4625 [Neofusicoccum parvum UCRNP2]GME32121.1 hypothetical protein GTA08_BOTSDO11341 [Neofusicoccum parvum]